MSVVATDGERVLRIELLDLAGRLVSAGERFEPGSDSWKLAHAVRLTSAQSEVCRRHGVTPDPPEPGSKLGIAGIGAPRVWPVNGLRHPPEGSTNGWYLWSGEELSSDPGFFQPLHVEHLGEHLPAAHPFLALPPGWRFLVAPGHEDVWFDASLLEAG